MLLFAAGMRRFFFLLTARHPRGQSLPSPFRFHGTGTPGYAGWCTDHPPTRGAGGPGFPFLASRRSVMPSPFSQLPALPAAGSWAHPRSHPSIQTMQLHVRANRTSWAHFQRPFQRPFQRLAPPRRRCAQTRNAVHISRRRSRACNASTPRSSRPSRGTTWSSRTTTRRASMPGSALSTSRSNFSRAGRQGVNPTPLTPATHTIPPHHTHPPWLACDPHVRISAR